MTHKGGFALEMNGAEEDAIHSPPVVPIFGATTNEHFNL